MANKPRSRPSVNIEFDPAIWREVRTRNCAYLKRVTDLGTFAVKVLNKKKKNGCSVIFPDGQIFPAASPEAALTDLSRIIEAQSKQT
jgi:hypothetical protein